MPQVESFDGDLVECPKCGTFLEAEDADTHAATHRKNSPSSRDRNPVSRTSPTEPPRPANGSYQSTRETNEVSSSAMNGAAKATAAPVEGPVSRLAQLLQVSPSAATSRSILCDSRLQLTLDNVDSPTTWACGYRNLQMLLSVLLAKDPTAAPAMLHRTGSRGVPDIATIQKTLEDAWKSGIDAVGAEHFFGKLVGKREWIGATDVAAFLIHLGVRPIIFDFHRPTDPEGNHPLLLDFVRDHFERRAGNETGKVVQTNAFPLYFQHQGEKRSIRTPAASWSIQLLCCFILACRCRSLENHRRLRIQPDVVQSARRRSRQNQAHATCRLPSLGMGDS